MKVCLINNLYPPYNRGSGAEIITQIMYQDLIKQGHEVIVISCKPYFSQPDNQPGLYYVSSLYPNLNKIPIALRFIWHIFHTIAWYKAWRISRIISQEKCELVISNNLEGLSYLTPRFIKTKHVHVLHDVQLLHPSGLMYYNQEGLINSFQAKVYQAICRWCFAKVKLVVAPSTWLMKLHQEKGFFKNNQTLILKNPQIEKTEKAEQTDQAEETRQVLDNRPFTFLSVGQVDYHKGVPVLVKAFNNLIKEQDLDCQLIIIGGGGLLEQLKAESKDNDKIKFLGKVPNEQVHKTMAEADCLIVPSLCYENSPTIIFEALHNNLPVIASKIGGIPEILDSNPYLLFEPNNLSKLQTKMYWAVQKPEQLKQEFNRVRDQFRQINVKEYFTAIVDKVNS